MFETKDSWQQSAAVAILSSGLIFSGVASAAQLNAATADQTADAYVRANPERNEVLTGRSAKRLKKAKRAHGASSVAGVPGAGHPVYKGESPIAPPIPACSAQSAYAIDKAYGIKMWDFQAFNMGDSILQDYGCWRTTLAQYGFGFLAYNVGLFQANMLNHYTPPSSQQQYNGQKPSGLDAAVYFLSYDLDRWGLPDGQISVWGTNVNTTNAPNYSQNRFSFAEIGLYGAALNKQLEYLVGIFPHNDYFQGNYIGGNVDNPLGSSAANSVLAGGSIGPEATPGFALKYHFNENWYNTFDISRSTPGTVSPTYPGYALGNRLAVENYANPTGLNFAARRPCEFGVCYPSPKEIFIDEIGYKQEASADNYYTFVRAQGFYSNTPVYKYNLASPINPTTTTGSFSILGDRQFWQTEPGSPHTGYKGLYVGATFAYNPPNSNTFSEDYEFRLYSFGLFGRPRDQIAFSFQHLTTSNEFAKLVNTESGCSSNITCVRHGTNIYNLTYTASIMSGVYATLGVTYDDHPGLVWSPLASSSGSAAYTAIPPLAPLNIQHAVFFDAALVTVF
jgi:porin